VVDLVLSSSEAESAADASAPQAASVEQDGSAALQAAPIQQEDSAAAQEKAELEASFADDEGTTAQHEPWELDDEDKVLLSSELVPSGAVSGGGGARLCRGLVQGAFGDSTAVGSAAQSLSGHQMRCGSPTLHRGRVAAHLPQRPREQCRCQFDTAERLSAVRSPLMRVPAVCISPGGGIMATACPML
jgi:hypothetical protein